MTLHTPPDGRTEWLEADGLGGFASGTVSGVRSRRYHALLLPATTPPTGRVVLVNGAEVWAETPAGQFALSAHRYMPGVTHPDGDRRIVGFTADPWPTWTYRLDDGTVIEHELFVPHGSPAVVQRWRLVDGSGAVRLHARPLLSGRDYHAMHRENGSFRFAPQGSGGVLCWHPYPGLPGVRSHANAAYEHRPNWFRNFLYEHERDRGLDCVEDLASPGVLTWDLSTREAVWVLAAGAVPGESGDPVVLYDRLRRSERARRAAFPSALHRAADAYLVRRGSGRTIIAGYPWFTDWGRDTFIALRGLCLATGRLDDAGAILRDWAGTVCDGMLPNRFPDAGDAPEFNSVDASLWYAIAVHDYLAAKPKAASGALKRAVLAIVEGYSKGTRFGIRADADGLLACGEPGTQLTWMDAKVGDWVVTPRVGKPVEVQALWANALWVASQFDARWTGAAEKARTAFADRFWNGAAGCLFDVIDVDHRPGTGDSSVRPNQIFAVGGLPLSLLPHDQARKVVDTVEARLWTPRGPRSLAQTEPGYRSQYRGGVSDRDGAYHQGTVWPWLAGPFIEAWVRVRGNSPAAKAEARDRFLNPLLAQAVAGFGHLSEIADADPPHAPNGCPFQAWSLGELLRLDQDVLK